MINPILRNGKHVISPISKFTRWFFLDVIIFPKISKYKFLKSFKRN